MENLTGGTPPVRPLPCVVPCKLYFAEHEDFKILRMALFALVFTTLLGIEFITIANYCFYILVYHAIWL